MGSDGELAEGEKSVLTLHPHWAMLLVAAVKAVSGVVVALAVSLAVRYVSSAFAHYLLYVWEAMTGAWFVGEFLDWRTTTYRLTTQRLQRRSGIVSRSGRDFPLVRISTVSFTRGPLGRLLGYGRLVVESPGQHSKLVLDEVSHVERVQATLFRLVEDEHARMAGRGGIAS